MAQLVHLMGQKKSPNRGTSHIHFLRHAWYSCLVSFLFSSGGLVSGPGSLLQASFSIKLELLCSLHFIELKVSHLCLSGQLTIRYLLLGGAVTLAHTSMFYCPLCAS